MLKSKTLQLLILSLLLITACGESTVVTTGSKPDYAPPEYEVEKFFSNPDRIDFGISPDGRYISWLAPWQNRLNIFVKPIGQDSAWRVSSNTDRDIEEYFWAGNDNLLYLKDTDGNELYKLYMCSADGKETKCLTDYEGVTVELIDKLDNRPNEVIIGLNKRQSDIFDPYLVNINTCELKMLYENPGDIVYWYTDNEGQLRLAVAMGEGETEILFRNSPDADFTTIYTSKGDESLEPICFGADNFNFYAASNLGRDKSAIVLFNPVTGKEEVVWEHAEYDSYEMHYSQVKKKPLFAQTYGNDVIGFFDDDTKKMFSTMEEKLPGYKFELADITADETKYIVKAYSDKSIGEYYFYDHQSGEFSLIYKTSMGIESDQLAEVKPITYQSRDGLTIHGYLTLPKGKEPLDLPVVIHPHGGPWLRDVWEYDPEVQFLANRGYAVLQVNYRGSLGYGQKFMEASYKQWGRAMQDDITDGVKWLITQGYADSNRVAIFGASYGGYATLAGLTFTPDLYACGVDYVGVSNLLTFMNSFPEHWGYKLDSYYKMVGNPIKDSLLLAERSPTLHADQIKAPLFIAQGAQDPRVVKSESDQMVAALKARGIEVEYMVKENEGHGFNNEENKLDLYRAVDRFLKKHLGKTCEMLNSELRSD